MPMSSGSGSSADKIAKIDTHTHQVTQYALPHKYSYPYGVVVDNAHNVWINLNNTDMLAKLRIGRSNPLVRPTRCRGAPVSAGRE